MTSSFVEEETVQDGNLQAMTSYAKRHHVLDPRLNAEDVVRISAEDFNTVRSSSDPMITALRVANYELRHAGWASLVRRVFGSVCRSGLTLPSPPHSHLRHPPASSCIAISPGNSDLMHDLPDKRSGPRARGNDM
jgi:hypothetical protein